MKVDAYKRIYAAVNRIPKGKVATYGQIARLAGLPGHARQVGYALSALPKDTIPWHRVINAKGEVSPRAIPHYEDRQRVRLERERIIFNSRGRVALLRYQWKSRTGSF